jgi:hypothetical protein
LLDSIRQHVKVVAGTSDNCAQLLASDFDAAKKKWDTMLLSEDEGDGEGDKEGDIGREED